jgi:hypothetical protein
LSTTSTRKGVRLTLPGAPDHPHRLNVRGLNLEVSPSTPTPVDDDELARVEELIAQGAALELVDMPDDPDAPAEPFAGYRDLSAKDVVARVKDADQPTVSAVLAFEEQQSNPRRTVIDAAAARISELEG